MVTPSIHNVSLDANITFECTEFGSPPFTYQWFMRNTSMEGSDKLLVGEDKNTYNISSVLYNHTGLYFCEASNMLGILSNSTPAPLLSKTDCFTLPYIHVLLYKNLVAFATVSALLQLLF